MSITILIILLAIVLTIVIFRTKGYDITRENMILAALENGEVYPEHFALDTLPSYFVVTYKDHDHSIKTYRIEATTKLEAEYLLCRDKLRKPFHIKNVVKDTI